MKRVPIRIDPQLSGDVEFEEFSLVTHEGHYWQGRTEDEVRQIAADLEANPNYFDGEPKPEIIRVVRRTVQVHITEWQEIKL